MRIVRIFIIALAINVAFQFVAYAVDGYEGVYFLLGWIGGTVYMGVVYERH